MCLMQELSDHNGSYIYNGNTAGTYTVRVSSHYTANFFLVGGGGGGGREEEASWRSPLPTRYFVSLLALRIGVAVKHALSSQD